MKKILGLDIATKTGWSLIEGPNLLEFGQIQLDSNMNICQKLNYFHLELKRLFERLNPDWCMIEDVLLGISGVKTLSYLSRLNGVAINTAYGIFKDNVKLYYPTYWKSKSLEGINGSSKKWAIQLAVCRHFNITLNGAYTELDSKLELFEQIIIKNKDDSVNRRKLINSLKSSLNRKRNPLNRDVALATECQIKENEKIIKHLKSKIKDTEKELETSMTKVSLDITAQTGLTYDICDACGIAVCGQKEINESTI